MTAPAPLLAFPRCVIYVGISGMIVLMGTLVWEPAASPKPQWIVFLDPSAAMVMLRPQDAGAVHIDDAISWIDAGSMLVTGKVRGMSMRGDNDAIYSVEARSAIAGLRARGFTVAVLVYGDRRRKPGAGVLSAKMSLPSVPLWARILSSFHHASSMAE